MEEEQPKEKEREFFDMFMVRAVMGEHLFNNNKAAVSINENIRNNQTVNMEVLYYEFIDLMRELVYEDNESKYDEIINKAQSRIDNVNSNVSQRNNNESNRNTVPITPMEITEEVNYSVKKSDLENNANSRETYLNSSASSNQERGQKRPLEENLINPNQNRRTRGKTK